MDLAPPPEECEVLGPVPVPDSDFTREQNSHQFYRSSKISDSVRGYSEKMARNRLHYIRHLEKKAEKEAAKQEAAAKSPAASTEVVVSDVVEGTAAEAEPKDVIDGTAEEKDPPSVEGPAAIDEKKDE